MAGGVRVVATYGQHLQQRGHEVVVVSRPIKPPTLKQQVKSVLRDQKIIPRPVQGKSHLDDMGLDHRMISEFRPIGERDLPDADVVVATWWETAEWVAKLPARKGAKVHYIQDHEIWGNPPMDRVTAVYRLDMPKIVISRFLRDLMREKYQRDPVALIENGVDLVQFDSPPRGKQPVPAMGTAYSNKHNKGTDLALKAYELAARQLPGLKLVMMSNEVMGELQLPPGTDFTYQARDKQLVDIYARCDVWLFSTRWEGFGLPLLESMACRTPVVAAPAGAAPDIVGRGGGILVPPENPQAMADAVRKVCTMPDGDWRALSETARTTASFYSWKRAVDLFEATLLGVAGKRA